MQIKPEKAHRRFLYIKFGGLLMISGLFLLFGVHVLLSAYRVQDPFVFVMTFFASNFIILISLALGIGFAVRLWRRPPARDAEDRPSEDRN